MYVRQHERRILYSLGGKKTVRVIQARRKIITNLRVTNYELRVTSNLQHFNSYKELIQNCYKDKLYSRSTLFRH